MNWKTEGRSAGYLNFEARQQEYRDGVNALLTERLEPRKSDEDRGFLLENTGIAESVEALKGDEQDKASVAVQLCEAVREYRETYGREPEPGQMAAVGAALKAFPEVYKSGLAPGSGQVPIIGEDVAFAATQSKDFTARPQFMVLSALLPLRTIASQLGYSVGFVPGDELEIHETDKKGDRYEIEDARETGTLDKVVYMSVNGTREFFNHVDTVPLVPGRVALIINGQKVAEDDGDGKFQLPASVKRAGGAPIDLVDSTIVYWSDTEYEVDITLSELLPDDMECALEYQIDVERYPDFIPRTGLQTRSLKLKSNSSMLAVGMSLQAVMRALHNMRLNLPDLTFKHLLYRLSASIDRQVIERVNVYAHKWDDNHKYKVGGAQLEYWSADAYASSLASFMSAMDDEIINRQNDENLKSPTGAKGGASIWIGGPEFRHAALMALSALKLPVSRDLAQSVYYRKRPCYLGELHGRRLFYSPDATMTGICKGARPSESPLITGLVSPMTARATGMETDLRQFCVLHCEDIRDFTPDAGLYLNTVRIQKDAEDHGAPSLYDPFGVFEFI